MGRRKKVADKAYDYIKHQITAGNWLEGRQIKELEISESLEISRTPIRNAFIRLKEEGFVLILPNKGVFVAASTINLKGIKERLHYLEAILQHILYTLELSECTIQTDDYIKCVSQMEKSQKAHSTQFEESEKQFWQSILGFHDNEYMNESVIMTLHSLISSNEYAREIFKESRPVKLSHYKALSELISQNNYVYARREVRILLNQLMINLIQGVD